MQFKWTDFNLGNSSELVRRQRASGTNIDTGNRNSEST